MGGRTEGVVLELLISTILAVLSFEGVKKKTNREILIPLE